MDFAHVRSLRNCRCDKPHKCTYRAQTILNVANVHAYSFKFPKRSDQIYIWKYVKLCLPILWYKRTEKMKSKNFVTNFFIPKLKLNSWTVWHESWRVKIFKNTHLHGPCFLWRIHEYHVYTPHHNRYFQSYHVAGNHSGSNCCFRLHCCGNHKLKK